MRSRRLGHGLLAALAATAAGAAFVASCSLVTPLGDLSTDYRADASDAQVGHDARRPPDAAPDRARDAGHDAPPRDTGPPPPPPHPASWSRSFGDSLDQFVYAVAVDSAGDIVVAGAFAGSIDFGGGAAASSKGGLDAFVALLDPRGNGLWVQPFGDAADAGAYDQLAYSVAVDPLGDVLVVGSFEGSIDIGGTQLASAGGKDAFVVKLDGTGAIQWKVVASGPGDQVALGAALDAMGHGFVNGSFEGAVTVGTNTYTSRGGFDTMTLGLSAAGAVSWVTTLGGPGDDLGTGVAVNPDGGPYVTGYFTGAPTFGPGDAAVSSAGGFDAFVYALVPASGTASPPRAIGDLANTYGYSVAVDNLGGVAIAGPFQGRISSFPGPPRVSAGLDDVFVAEMDLAGNPRWASSFGDSEDQVAFGVALDPAGYVVVTGAMKGGAQVGPSLLRSAGGNDVFLARFDPDGKPLWGERFGDSLDQQGTAVATTSASGTYDIVLVGNFRGSIDLGKGTLVSQGGSDFFVASIPP